MTRVYFKLTHKLIHGILNAFDKALEVRGIFRDTSKAFDKVWHDGLIFKLRQNGIRGDIINILQDFLRNRKQRVVLNGQCSSWADVNAGVPQGSILGPLLFLIYINDLFDGLKSECKLFADDTFLFSVVNDINTSASDINEDLEIIGNLAFKWKINFNPDPNKQAQEVIFSRKKTASLDLVVYFDTDTDTDNHNNWRLTDFNMCPAWRMICLQLKTIRRIFLHM